MREVLHEVVTRTFPVQPNLAFAYGSGVFAQPERSKRKPSADRPMVDFIFAVDDAYVWHEQNLLRNPHHYSFLKHTGARVIELIQVILDNCRKEASSTPALVL